MRAIVLSASLLGLTFAGAVQAQTQPPAQTPPPAETAKKAQPKVVCRREAVMGSNRQEKVCRTIGGTASADSPRDPEGQMSRPQAEAGGL